MELSKLPLLPAVLAALASVGSCTTDPSPAIMARTPPAAAHLNHLNQTIFADNSTCAVNCSLALDKAAPSLYKWLPFSVTKTVTAATLLYVVKTDGSPASSTLVPNPDAPAPPRVDAGGTRYEEISVAGSLVRVAYPTSYIDWAGAYAWHGVLLTRTAPSAAEACVTETADVAVTLGGANPQPTTGQEGPDAADPGGLHFSLVPAEDPTLRKKYAGLFADHAAFDLCEIIPDKVHQPEVPPGVAWVTATVTSTEGVPGAAVPVKTGTNVGASQAGGPHVPEETDAVQGGQVVESGGGGSDGPGRPVSAVSQLSAHAGVSVTAGKVPASASGKSPSPSKSGSAKPGGAHEAAAIHSAMRPSLYISAGLAFMVVFKLWL